MPIIKINGQEHEVPSGINALEACQMTGIYVPHFCYHPALTVVGSCRMCKVEVVQGGRRRIEISCNLPVSEGLEIWTETPAVKKQRQMTLEYLLENHPLDCPICDDSGECDLQNFYMVYGLHPSRLREPKVRKFKAKDIGKTVVLDSERCVLCSRCVRFCAEVTKTNELGIFGMGATEKLDLKPGAQLDNDYSGCVVDLCPVGALTDKDFRFKRRVWYLHSVPSICPGCSRGCNVRLDYDLDPFHQHKKNFQMRTYRTPATTHQRIQRIKPRYNDAVNGYWICDAGRYGYKWVDAEDRVLTPLIRSEEGIKILDWESALAKFREVVEIHSGKNGERAMVVVSPRLTCEELYAIRRLFKDVLGWINFDHRLPIDPGWYGDDLLRTPDPFPNRIGAEWIGIEPSSGGIFLRDLEEAVLNDRIKVIISFDAHPTMYLSPQALKRLSYVIGLCSNLGDKSFLYEDLILPLAAWGEYRGLFTNFRGRIQRCEKAFKP
ncbi:MAG: 2Fe-2S iron-sulfur cluster-binding protein, partial [bacterium]